MLVQLRSRVANAEAFRGKVCTEADVTLKLQGDADLYKPDGTPLCILRRAALTVEATHRAYPALHELRKYKSDNRGTYAGGGRVAVRYQDGTRSKNTRVRNTEGKITTTATAIIGYFDRQGGRFPFCRETRFTANEVEGWGSVQPVIREVAQLFAQTVPDRHHRQMEECRKVARGFIIDGTPFSTLTVNNNVAPSGVHKDAGDFKDGFGIISVHRYGDYTGAWLVFPEYQVGVDLQHNDVIFFNTHDWHGVTAMEKRSEDAERISVVYYLRSKMTECGTPAEELKRARARGNI